MLPKSVQNLIDQFSKLPGIGPKTAARLTFYLLSKPKEEVSIFGQAVSDLGQSLCYCADCFNISEALVCKICENEKRDRSKVAVVEEPLDVIALEKSLSFEGVYHVLGGSISPINGIGPEQLRIEQLLSRLREGVIEELIMATNPDLEGEATAAFIKSRIDNLGINVRVTRIARGLPVGGDLEYADEITLKRSIEGRKEY